MSNIMERNPLRKLCFSLNLSEKEFALKTGITYTTVRAFENGYFAEMGDQVAEKLSVVSNVPTKTLQEDYVEWLRELNTDPENQLA